MWYESTGKDTDVVISTRIRLARNLAGIPFPGKMSAEEAGEIISKTKSALTGENLDFINVSAAEPLYNTILLEDHLVSSELISSKTPCGVFVGENLSTQLFESFGNGQFLSACGLFQSFYHIVRFSC